MSPKFKIIHPERFKTLVYTAVFFFTLFFQCVLFHYLAFHSILISSIITSPVSFWAFYLPKLCICCFLSFLVPLFKKKEWTIIVSIIVGIWILSELVYYRVNGIFLDAYSFTMVGNMKGFWEGVFAFVRPNDLFLLLPTLTLVVFFYLLKPHIVSRLSALVLLLLSIGFHVAGTLCLNKQMLLWNCVDLKGNTNRYYNPFSEKGVRLFWGWTTIDYAKQTSVIHCIVLDAWNLVKMPFTRDYAVSLSMEDQEMVQPLFNIDVSQNYPNGNLYIILFESFENWSISPVTTPIIYDFIQSHDNIIWAQKVTRQTKGGTSADGQMIVNTGVLPVMNGATCFRFFGNCYPSLSEIYGKSALIQPGNMAIWNQKRMSDAYHITDNFVVPDSNDAVTFSKLTDLYQYYPYIMAVSMASHTPFSGCPADMKMLWDSTMPEMMRNYLDCVHYTDCCLKDFLQRVDEDEILKNSTIIITGDHTIFDEDMRHTFNDYCVSRDEHYAVNDAYCPFIIYSPVIKNKRIVDDVVFQMDIFPTALSAIGCDSTYYWKGFGKNLIDGTAKRTMEEKQAFILSDRMIQSNYWSQMKHEQ